MNFLLLNSRVKAICWSGSWSWWSVFPKCYVKIFSESFVYKTQISRFNITCLVVDVVCLFVVAHPFNTAGKTDIFNNNSSFISVLWISRRFSLRSIIVIWSFILSRQSTVSPNCRVEFRYDLLRFVYIKIIILKCTF